MATYTFSRDSPRNTVLTDADGNIAYKISSPFAFKNFTTTITRANESDVVAVIHWSLLNKDKITMNGVTQNINDVFPRSKKLGTSRVYTTAAGEQFKWKYTTRLYCVSKPSDLNIATFYQSILSGIGGRRSTLDINQSALHLSDILVATWVIMQKEWEEYSASTS
ncbi:unnamed protein product [Rhizoctonia solani]|uniref:DUF6593 domain-containing protein n=1 Tax=Rhizoctonia solani TaxID=456999 RepID=A0A8H2XQ20_9AGAM|nr:unnamed protein product [Rhizoctonia solani]CAE6451618.1 unnamed protein product [Rhizoctonia solani]